MVLLHAAFFCAKTGMINTLQNVHTRSLPLCTCMYIYTSVNAMFMFWLKQAFWGTEIVEYTYLGAL